MAVFFAGSQGYGGIKLSEKMFVHVVQPNPTIIFLILNCFGFVQGEASSQWYHELILVLIPVGLDGKG